MLVDRLEIKERINTSQLICTYSYAGSIPARDKYSLEVGMKDAGLINFRPYNIIIESKTEPKGQEIGKKIKLEFTGELVEVHENTMVISPIYKHQRIEVKYDVIREKRTTQQGKFFFKLLTEHVPQLHELGIYSKDDLYHGLKIHLQKIRPFWKVFQDQDSFTITKINKDKEFTELIYYTDMFLTVELGIDTKKFWDTYTNEYEEMGYKK